ncbi:hypothetical protein LTR39_005117 [Cryomyces antarcticus]|nr:hypothetical protein LTR39_005117 [Cryomyces antarcticus]
MGEVELNAAPLEQRLQSDPIVHAALVGGQGRTRSLLLLEIAEHKDADGGRGEAVREMVWPAVREGDEHAAKWTGGEGPFVRLGKGSVDRRSRFKLYEQEIKNAHVAAAT